MPKINFPSVPIAEGVPSLARSAYGIAQKSGATGRAMGLTGGLAGTFLGQYLNSMLAPTYALLDRNGNKLIQPDGPGEFEMKADANISNYPVEDGGFQSYNKVVNPEELTITLLCGGQGPMSRERFLARCRELKNGTDIVTLVTPDQVYRSVVCTGMGYSKRAVNGATLLTVTLPFKEVRDGASSTYAKAKRDSSNPVQESGRGETKSKFETTMDDWGVTDGIKKINNLMKDVGDTASDAASYASDALSKAGEGIGDAGRYFGKYGIG